MTRSNGSSAAAAIATRTMTITSGGKSLTAIPTNRKDPPHRTERNSSRPQSRRAMVAGGIGVNPEMNSTG